jgi:hypothetical protein
MAFENENSLHNPFSMGSFESKQGFGYEPEPVQVLSNLKPKSGRRLPR